MLTQHLVNKQKGKEDYCQTLGFLLLSIWLRIKFRPLLKIHFSKGHNASITNIVKRPNRIAKSHPINFPIEKPIQKKNLNKTTKSGTAKPIIDCLVLNVVKTSSTLRATCPCNVHPPQ